PHYAGHVSIEAKQLAILPTYHSVTSANLCCKRVSFEEVLQNLFFVRHGHAEPADRNIADANHQVIQRLGMKREIQCVDVLPAKSRIQHDRRKRMRHRITNHTINPRGSIHLVNAISFTQGTRRNLAGAGFFSRTGGGKGELASGANTEKPAD